MSEVLTVAVDEIRAREDQPRQYFDEQGIRELADSMLSKGFLPGNRLVVRRVNGYFELLAGHRRLKAAALAHIVEVPVEVVDLDEQAAREVVLLDNLNRADFLPWEEGAGYKELVDKHGVGLAGIAGKAGKSTAYVKGRIDLAEGAGDKAREAYIEGRLGLVALQAVAALPCRILAPIRCPRCKVINAEGSEECVACRQAFLGIPRIDAPGNPQEVAVTACRGRQAAAVPEVIQRVKQSYGLSSVPVQTSLGLDDAQLSEEVVQAKSAFERRLEQVSRLQGWLAENKRKLQQLTSDQLRAVAQQGQVIEAIGRQVQAAGEEELARRQG